MATLETTRSLIWRLNNQPLAVRLLLGAGCLITAAAVFSAPVEADPHDDDFIDAYIELKMSEVERFEMTPHPIEFEMYYSL